MATYDHKEIEKKAQEKWASLDLYHTDLSDESREPYYLLVEFPYPSGDLHIGHWYAFAVTDIYARMLRMRGKNVLFPIGFDAFGLPAENAAIKHGLDPKEWTYKNIERMRAQLATMGASFDWSKEIVACEPSYYQWTQWLFTKLFEQGLAEHREASVKWCPKDQTVLANEQVIDGHCERCGTAVEEKRLTQWFLKITAYAERLLTSLDTLPWREEIKEAQRAWIGKSEGAYLEFPITGHEEKIKVFTTRPDTIFGATYVVLAPEHPLVSSLTSAVSNKKQVTKYVKVTTQKTERERSENKQKTGVKLEGVVSINPATKEEIPIYIADYVLASYGTGAVMAVPAHDERDYEFAQKISLPIKQVVVPCADDEGNPPQEGFEEVRRDTVIVHLRDISTGKFALLKWHGTLEGITTAIMGGVESGQTPEQAALAEIREEASLEKVRIVQKLRWITAARYCASHKKENRCAHSYAFMAEVDSLADQGKIHPDEQAKHTLIWVDESEVLSDLVPAHQKQIWQLLHAEKALTGDGYLINSGEFDGRSNEEAKWDIVAAVGGEKATQYRLRDWLVSRQRYWGCPIPIVYDPEGKPHVIPADHLPWLLPTDVDFTPTGKAPLASSQELKERVTRIFGEGWTPEYDTLDTFVDSSWYFLRYLDSKDAQKFSDVSLMKRWLPVNRYSGGSEHTTMHLLYARFFMKALYDLALVPVDEPFTERFNRGLIMGPDGQKMSKSKGNVLNPDEFVQKYGADAVRIYLAFIGPYNEPGSYPWNLEGVASMRKFLERIARLVERANDDTEVSVALQQAIARTTVKVAEDGDRFKFNTAVAALMILTNELEAVSSIPNVILGQMLIILAPFAPHLVEHLWEKLGKEGSVHQQSWPVIALAAATKQEVVVQVNGKRRASLSLTMNIPEAEVLAAARALPSISNALSGKEPKRVIYVPGKIINLVV
ncbi:MAG: class I tRNA ligase family protein [Minisyncoccota bacterium]